MKRTVILVLVLIAGLACGGTAPAANTQPAATDGQQVPPTSTAGADEPAFPAPAAAAVRYGNGSLWMDIVDLPDGKIVDTPQIIVAGMAPPETVISLNDTIIVVGADGTFQIPVALAEGPNVLEIVASNLDGDEVGIVLTVIYEIP